MAAISPPGSRAGLITALVIFVVLFITATIFAIYFNAQERQARTQLADETKRYREITDDPNSTQIAGLQKMRGDKALGFSAQEKLLNVSTSMTEKLAGLIIGRQAASASTAAEAGKTAMDAAVATLEGAQKKLTDNKIELTLPTAGGNLVEVVNTLTNAVITLQNKALDQQKLVEQAQAQLASAIEENRKAMEQKDKELGEARQALQTEHGGLASDRASKQKQIEELEAARATERNKAIEDINKKEESIRTLSKNLDKVTKELAAVRGRMAELRFDTQEPLIRQADARISRLGSGNIVYIDRGAGDHLVTGLTFEVYDKNEGIPALGDKEGDEELPQGKASIEVIRVGANSSECRVIRAQRGRTLTEGDYAVNLVYDRNTKYQFMVYGDFDLDQNNVATSQDSEVIKRLITQWGGKVVNKVDVSTDFLVLGVEPKIPEFTKEELEGAANVKKLQDAQAALAAYDEVKKQAIDLHIPVLNQNRFLYFVGYYDMSKR